MIVFSIFVLFIVILLFKLVPQHRADMLASVPKSKKAVTCLTEKTGVFHKLNNRRELVWLAVSSMLMNQQ